MPSSCDSLTSKFVGNLRMHTYTDPILRRMVTCVELTEPGAHPDRTAMLLPTVLYMKLISLANDALVITGFERIEVAGGRQADFAQTSRPTGGGLGRMAQPRSGELTR